MLAASALGFAALAQGSPGVIVVAALVAAGLGWSWPGGLNLAVVRRSPEAPAWAVGVMLTGLFAGAVCGPLAVGCWPTTATSPAPGCCAARWRWPRRPRWR